MVKVTYIESNGTEHTLEVAEGLSLMEGAVKNNLKGIDADCGGACACSTCHVYIDPQWASVVGKPNANEEDMLDFAFDVKETSRLSCQVRLTTELNGLVVRLPAKQF
jgi:2Fe-2S ferredoxin